MGTFEISHSGKTFRFRVDPNSVRYTYNLNTKVEATYGGQVVQILSVNLGDLIVQADSGAGRWEYFQQLTQFCRDLMFYQKDTGEPATVIYPLKGWELKVYLVSLPYSDSVGNVKYPFTLRFRIQEDVSGVVSSDSMTSELNKVRDGIGYERNDYNYPIGGVEGTGLANLEPGSPDTEEE